VSARNADRGGQRPRFRADIKRMHDLIRQQNALLAELQRGAL
jgi:hypothetical protein